MVDEQIPTAQFEVGTGDGKTAAQLAAKRGLGQLVVAHETNTFLAFESITRSAQGQPNFFVSRQNAVGEAAVHGEGVYTKIGLRGGRQTGLTIRMTIDPLAREGTDFKIASGDFLILLNKSAASVIRESLNITPFEYFEMVANGEGIDSTDRGILETFRRKLVAGRFSLSERQKKQIKKWLENSRNRGLLANEFVQLGWDEYLTDATVKIAFMANFKSTSQTVSAISAKMVEWVREAKSPRDMMLVLSPGIAKPSDAYKEAIGQIWARNVGRFAALRPTAKEITDAKLQINNVDTITELARILASEARSAAEMLNALDPAFPVPSDAYRQRLDTVWLSYARKFADLRPTIAEMSQMKRWVYGAEAVVTIGYYASLQAKSVEDILAFMAPIVAKPTDQYTALISKWWVPLASKFSDLKPSVDQIHRAEAMLRTVPDAIAFLRVQVAAQTTAEAMLSVLNPPRSKSDAYVAELRKLAQSGTDKFLSMKPTHDQIVRFKSTVSSIDGVMLIVHRLLNQAKSPQDFIDAFRDNFPNPTDAYRQKKSAVVAQYASTFVRLKPSFDQIMQMKTGLWSSDWASYGVALAPLARSKEELKQIVAVGKHLTQAQVNSLNAAYWRYEKALPDSLPKPAARTCDALFK